MMYWNSSLPHPSLRPNGELAVLHRSRQLKLVIGPPGGPISTVYRNSQYWARIANTVKTQEQLN